MMEFDAKALSRWMNAALTANLTYHINRKNTFDELLKCRRNGGAIRLTPREFYVLKHYLTMRSAKLQDSDDATLAFQEMIGRLYDRMEEPGSELQSEEDEQESGGGAPSGLADKPGPKLKLRPKGSGSQDKKDKDKDKDKSEEHP